MRRRKGLLVKGHPERNGQTNIYSKRGHLTPDAGKTDERVFILFFKKDWFIFICVHLSEFMCTRCVQMSPRGQRVSDPGTWVNHLIWVLETKIRSFARTFNCWAIFAALEIASQGHGSDRRVNYTQMQTILQRKGVQLLMAEGKTSQITGDTWSEL